MENLECFFFWSGLEAVWAVVGHSAVSVQVTQKDQEQLLLVSQAGAELGAAPLRVEPVAAPVVRLELLKALVVPPLAM